MQKFTFNRNITGFFSDQQNRLAYDQESLLPFIQRVFSKEAFRKQVELKAVTYTDNQRSTLLNVINQKYSAQENSLKTQENIKKLGDRSTFTVTTGHQLSLATGPVFSIYKILHTIRLAEELSADNDAFQVVPVFWMASEDHDIEEVRAVDVFNSRLIWETKEQGAVGRMSSDGLTEIKEQILQLFSNQNSSELSQILERWEGETYGEAFFRLIHNLFDSYGLIIVDGDNRQLKRQFADVVKQEILEMPSFMAVNKTNELLLKEGAKIQVNPREINLFYLDEGGRNRIVFEDNKYNLNSQKQVDKEELLIEIESYPERFSPNVILRPVYQELVLPNLCYLGGVGEIAYWVQLKSTFEAFNIPYPLITPRISMLWIDAATSKKMAKIDMSIEDLFREVSTVKKDRLLQEAAHQLDFEKVDNYTMQLTTSISDQAKNLDLNAEKMVAAEIVKLNKQVDLIKDKMLRSMKQQHENVLNQIDQVFTRLFPDGSLQERKLNIFSMCPTGAIHARIEQLHDAIDPFDMDFVVLKES